MTFADLIPIYMALLATASAVTVTIRYILTARIRPIEEKLSLMKKQEGNMEHEIHELRNTLLEEVKKIARENFEFRLRYEQGIAEIKLLLAEKHISKHEFYKEIEKINNKVDASL
jgi:hypothetical protein